MKKVLFLIGVLFITSFAAMSQTIPPKVDNYLKKNYPGWTIGESWVIESKPRRAFETGDFNGDGKKDYAVLITKNDRKYALALLALKNSYQAFNLLAQNADNSWIAGIDINPKGAEVYLSSPQNGLSKPFLIKNDGVYLYDGEGHGRTYYWQNGQFLWGNDF